MWWCDVADWRYVACHSNEVTVHWAGQCSYRWPYLGKGLRYVKQPTRFTQPTTLAGWEISTCQSALCGWKAKMAYSISE